ncbi:MAG: alpha-L-fucosidase [Sedimentisphaerales bacterium]|nr:alpha-L-fucosidase [Sedimentisphaerales bacterium]
MKKTDFFILYLAAFVTIGFVLFHGCASEEQKVKEAATKVKPVEAQFDPVAGTAKAVEDVTTETVKTVEQMASEVAKTVGGAASEIARTVEGTIQQKYEVKWDSLDKRPTPKWFDDAKFGIFIHWGVYSVPAWGPKGQYAEWYWRRTFDDKQNLQDNEWSTFHKEYYGSDFAYKDFAKMFTCEMYDPDQWADIFYRSGAKYIVLTSKHHEGFCLWPNEQASKTWGRPWNAVETGPKRDILGDLTVAVRKRGIRMGYYFSLYEWFNPLWLDQSKRQQYVNEHMLPQVKDLVTRYNPDILWSDGEWDMTSDKWRSEELLAWLFNESVVKDTIAINDRWGKECRHNHGGYYTTEYGAGLAGATHPWEECRGMGHSFGYNRNEGIDDYKSAREMILILIDLTSRGGCLLLDIGPTADGRIPVIMQQRLIEIGDWLKINGEAIYATRTWKNTCQWSDGEKPEQEYKEYKAKYNVLDIIGSGPKEGKAVKEAFFTMKENAIYAILPAWPGTELILKDVNPAKDAMVTMLGYNGALPWKRSLEGMTIDLSEVKVRDLPCKYAWTIKIQETQ